MGHLEFQYQYDELGYCFDQGVTQQLRFSWMGGHGTATVFGDDGAARPPEPEHVSCIQCMPSAFVLASSGALLSGISERNHLMDSAVASA